MKQLTTALGKNGTLLKIAIYRAIIMWSDPHNERFLRRTVPGQLKAEEEIYDWFGWFLGDWFVERNLKRKHRTAVREYFDREFRKLLTGRNKPKAIDDAPKHIQDEEWSSGKKKPCLPTSLVSKIGFYLDRDELIPYDTLARRGLRRLTNQDIRKGNLGIYEAYHKAFRAAFNEQREDTIRRALKRPCVKKFAKRFHCRLSNLNSTAFRRKVFDNYLMLIGKEERDAKWRTGVAEIRNSQ